MPAYKWAGVPQEGQAAPSYRNILGCGFDVAYVRPNWIRDMKVMVRYGLHTFYRPRNWGDGAGEAHWGTAANSVKPAAHHPAKPLTPAQKRFAYRKT